MWEILLEQICPSVDNELCRAMASVGLVKRSQSKGTKFLARDWVAQQCGAVQESVCKSLMVVSIRYGQADFSIHTKFYSSGS